MYQPALRPQQIKALYYLKLQVKRPMTQLVRDAVDQYLDEHGGIEQLIPQIQLSSVSNKDTDEDTALIGR